jgi:hypothetical protein
MAVIQSRLNFHADRHTVESIDALIVDVRGSIHEIHKQIRELYRVVQSTQETVHVSFQSRGRTAAHTDEVNQFVETARAFLTQPWPHLSFSAEDEPAD